MNILILTSTFPANKSDIVQHPFQIDLIDLLRKEGHQVTILTHAKGECQEKIREDLDIVWFPWRKVKGRLAEIDFVKPGNLLALFSLLFNGIRHTRRIVGDRKIDVVISLWVIPSGLYVFANALLGQVKAPYLLWALGSDINKYRGNALMRLLLRRILRGGRQVFADGFELCDTVSGLSGRKCEFLPTFRALEPKSVQQVDTGAGTSFLFVGRHSRVKGIDLLIEAVALLDEIELASDFTVIIAGDGELTLPMTELVQRKKIGHRITFAGKVSDEELFGLYTRTNCVIIPSRSESIPVVLSESLQLNKPMIVTEVGDMGLLGRKYGIARVVAAEDVQALADAMREFLAEPFLLEPAKRSELLALLMLENSAKKLLHVISSLEAQCKR